MIAVNCDVCGKAADVVICQACTDDQCSDARREGKLDALEDIDPAHTRVGEWAGRQRLLAGMPDDVLRWFERCIEDLKDGQA